MVVRNYNRGTAAVKPRQCKAGVLGPMRQCVQVQLLFKSFNAKSVHKLCPFQYMD